MDLDISLKGWRKEKKKMLAKQNQYTIDMVVYAASLKAHYAYYVQTWNKSGKREYSIETSLYLKAAKNAGSDEFKKVFKNRERLV